MSSSLSRLKRSAIRGKFFFNTNFTSQTIKSSSVFSKNSTRNYHENVIEHYENPRNVGSLDKSSKNVGTYLFLDIYVFIYISNVIY